MELLAPFSFVRRCSMGAGASAGRTLTSLMKHCLRMRLATGQPSRFAGHATLEGGLVVRRDEVKNAFVKPNIASCLTWAGAGERTAELPLRPVRAQNAAVKSDMPSCLTWAGAAN